MRKEFIFLVIVIITMMSWGKNDMQKARVSQKKMHKR
jgi:hypothetical protein